MQNTECSVKRSEASELGLTPEQLGEGIRFERIRRITGYLVGDVSRWNNGKKAELNDRTKSEVNNELEHS